MTTRTPLLLASALLLPLIGLSAGSAAAGSAAVGPCAEPTIVGTPDDDTLRGTDGPDVIAGLEGDDRLIGLAGDDVLCGGPGQDVVRGGPGADRLEGGTDAKVAEDTDYWIYYGDTLIGGADDDVLVPGADPRHPGSVDIVSFADAAAGIQANLVAGTVTSTGATAETDTIIGVARTLIGSAYADTIIGSDGPEDLYAGAGDDRVNGNGGDDWVDGGSRFRTDHDDNVLRGGPGDDTVNSGAGDDLLFGGLGNDLLQAGHGIDHSYGGYGRDGINDEIEDAPNQVLQGGPGRGDTLSGVSFYNADGRYQRHLVGRIEMVPGTLRTTIDGHRMRLAVRGFEEVPTPDGDLWTVIGTPRNDVIYSGLDDSVRLFGRAGNDRLFGGAGHDDLLNGGPGHDEGSGWGGHDRLISIEHVYR